MAARPGLESVHVTDRYHVSRILGSGSFGLVAYVLVVQTLRRCPVPCGASDTLACAIKLSVFSAVSM